MHEPSKGGLPDFCCWKLTYRGGIGHALVLHRPELGFDPLNVGACLDQAPPDRSRCRIEKQAALDMLQAFTCENVRLDRRFDPMYVAAVSSRPRMLERIGSDGR